MNVYAGVHNSTEIENTRVFMRSSDYHIYEDYDYEFDHNIAILKLSEPMPFNQYISAIALNLNPGHLHGKYTNFKFTKL